MSAFKRINKSDVVTLPYVANKTWRVSSSDLSANGIYVYTGKKYTGTFNPNIELTSNGEYQRLVYDSINHLFINPIQDQLFQQFKGSHLYIILISLYIEQALHIMIIQY